MKGVSKWCDEGERQECCWQETNAGGVRGKDNSVIENGAAYSDRSIARYSSNPGPCLAGTTNVNWCTHS